MSRSPVNSTSKINGEFISGLLCKINEYLAEQILQCLGTYFYFTYFDYNFKKTFTVTTEEHKGQGLGVVLYVIININHEKMRIQVIIDLNTGTFRSTSDGKRHR